MRVSRSFGAIIVCVAGVACGLVVASADKEAIQPPPHVAGEQLALTDCTVECAAIFPNQVGVMGSNPYPRDAVPLQLDEIGEPTRKQLLSIVSRWALAQCYLPCAYEMCACLLTLPDGNFAVHIAPKDLNGHIAAEAMLFIGSETLKIEDQIRFHSPCREHARAIDWWRESCE